MHGDTPVAGQVIGNYEILRELGRGGMGIVYKAHETSLNRTVALKVLPSYLAQDDAFLNRFVREARAAASLIHPSVVTIHAVGEDNGTHFIAMEYVKGQTISQLIRQSGTIHPERALQIILDAADALTMAHKRGIVHRDIKPQNIMIDEAGRVKVMDFGLARAVTSESNLTADGAMIGTPMYMSPEQCEGKKADHRSDIYALGVVLYEMLTGRTPYDAATPLAIMRQIVDRPFPNVSELSPVVSPEVNRILHRMVAKNLADRYQNIEEVKRDIVAALGKGAPASNIYNEKTVAVDAANTQLQGHSVSQVDTRISPSPPSIPGATPATVMPTAPSAPRSSSATVGIVAAVITALLMLVGFLLLQRDSGSSEIPGATVAVTPPSNTNTAPPAPAQSEVDQANRQADELAQRAQDAAAEEVALEAAELEAQQRADEQAALLAAAEESAREAQAEEAEAALAELERRKAEAEAALAQLEEERLAREQMEQQAAELKAAEEEARLKAAELERQQQEAEAAQVAVAGNDAEQRAAEEAAARKAAEQEAARKRAAEEEAARVAAQQDAARIAAEEEAARLAAATPQFPDISGSWQASGTQPHEEDRGKAIEPTASISVNGASARIHIDGKDLTGQYSNGRLTGKWETTISATGRSGKGKTQVAQVWEVKMQAVSNDRLEGTYSVTHSGFQASEAAKNGTRTQSCVLTR